MIQARLSVFFIDNRQLLTYIPPNTVIKIDGNTITPRNSVKNLGVYMHCSLLVDKHTDEMSQKVIDVLIFVSHITENLEKPFKIPAVQ